MNRKDEQKHLPLTLFQYRMCSNTYRNKANLMQQYNATLTETGAALNIYKPSPVQF